MRWHLSLAATAFLLGGSLGYGGENPPTRTWTSTVGTQVRAALVDVEGQQARLERTDGTVISVPIDKLSTTDQEFIRQWLDRRAARSYVWKVFKHRSMGDEFRGKVLQRFGVKGRHKLEVQDATGKTGWIWEDEWEITKTPADVLGQGAKSSDGGASASGQSAAGLRSSDGNIVEFSPLVAGEAGATAGSVSGSICEVVAEGIGLDPDKAVQNAFSRAIEQAVGVLVDSETIVKNDEIIRDQILTFSRGYVEKFEVLKRWEEGGLHHARLRATVARTKLVEKLEASNIAVQALPGERMANQAEFEVMTEKNAAEIFAGAMKDFRIDNLVKVELIGKPEVVDKDETHARVKVSAKLVPDESNWQKFSTSIRSVLSKLAVSRSVCSCGPGNRWGDSRHGWSQEWYSTGHYEPRISDPPRSALQSRLNGEGVLVGLFVSANKTAEMTRWEFYRVPKTLKTVIEDCQLPKYHMVYSFLDAEDVAIQQKRSRESIGGKPEYPTTLYMLACETPFSYGDECVYWLSFMMWGKGNGFTFARSVHHEVVVDIELSKLSRMTKCVAYLEEAKENP